MIARMTVMIGARITPHSRGLMCALVFDVILCVALFSAHGEGRRVRSSTNESVLKRSGGSALNGIVLPEQFVVGIELRTPPAVSRLPPVLIKS